MGVRGGRAMFCTNCGVTLEEADRFCSQCGKPAGVGAAPRTAERKLTLPAEGKKLLGVCAGFARYFDMDVTLMRIIWLAGSLATGVGFLAYLIAWLLMPKDPVAGMGYGVTAAPAR